MENNNNQTMANVKKRIMEIIYNNHINIYKLSNITDITDSSIRNWFSKRDCSPSLESICKICDYFGLSLAQFFVSENEMLFPVKDEEKAMLETYITLSEDDKKLVNDLIIRLKGK